MTAKEFFETYKMDVFRTCCYMVRNVQDAEDLCQEVFVIALQQDFQQIEKPKPWLLAITMNTCRNFLKRKRRLVLKDWVLQMIDPQCVDDAFEAKQQTHELARMLAKLPGHLRAVIVLKYFHQLKNEEVAVIMRIPLGTVKSRCHKAIQLLRKQVNQEDVTLFVREGTL